MRDLKYIKEIEKMDIPWIRAVYEEAFPKDEKKPFDLILQKAKEGKVDILVYQDKDPVAFAINMKAGDRVLVDYLAIDKLSRGNGYGTYILNHLREEYKTDRICLEIEEVCEVYANYEQRKARKSFYIKNGLRESGMYVSLFGVDMEILLFDKEMSFQEYLGIYEYVYGEEVKTRITDIKR